MTNTEYNPNLEITVLSLLFKDGSLYEQVEDIIEPSSFGCKGFGTIYSVFELLVSSEIYPDITTVSAHLEKTGLLNSISIPSNAALVGMDALRFILEYPTENAENIDSYAYQIQQFNGSRKLKELSKSISARVTNGDTPSKILSAIDFETGKIGAFIGVKSSSLKESRTVITSVIEKYEDAAKGNDRYIATGIKAWDDYTNGLFPGRLYIIAAASNDGKSALAQNIMHNISIVNKVKGFIVSLEMSSEEVVNRFVQIMTGISPLAIEKADLSQHQLEPFKSAVKAIGEAPIIFDDSNELPLSLLRTKIRKAVEAGAKYVIIDQLEMISADGQMNNQAEYIKLNYIAYRIKSFARAFDVPIILIHQMNRSADSRDNKKHGSEGEPQLQDLSQASERPADAVLMIRHKKENQEILESYFYCTKNRQCKK